MAIPNVSLVVSHHPSPLQRLFSIQFFVVFGRGIGFVFNSVQTRYLFRLQAFKTWEILALWWKNCKWLLTHKKLERQQHGISVGLGNFVCLVCFDHCWMQSKMSKLMYFRRSTFLNFYLVVSNLFNFFIIFLNKFYLGQLVVSNFLQLLLAHIPKETNLIQWSFSTFLLLKWEWMYHRLNPFLD